MNKNSPFSGILFMTYTNLNIHNHNFNGATQIQCAYSKEKHLHDLLENQHNIYVDSIALFEVAGKTTRNTLFQRENINTA